MPYGGVQLITMEVLPLISKLSILLDGIVGYEKVLERGDVLVLQNIMTERLLLCYSINFRPHVHVCGAMFSDLEAR